MKPRLALLFVTILFLSAKCSKDPVIVVDPCAGKTAFKADFTIEESVGDTAIITDKAMAPGYVYFKAKGVYDSVRWFIGGSQNTSTRSQYTLFFNQAVGTVNATFIGYRKPNVSCFPNDKASDTVRKSITIIPRDEKAVIVGSYLGYNEGNPADTFTVTVSFYNNTHGYFIKNLPKGCQGYTTASHELPLNIGLPIRAGYSAFQIDAGSPSCSLVKGYGTISKVDSLIINYSYFPQLSSNPYLYANEAKKEKFVGIRKL